MNNKRVEVFKMVSEKNFNTLSADPDLISGDAVYYLNILFLSVLSSLVSFPCFTGVIN
jgi:hypothetical protein